MAKIQAAKAEKQAKAPKGPQMSPEEIAAKALKDQYAERRYREGKTAKDRANGAKAKNEQNKQSRAMWQTDSKRTTQNFPAASCNGKRNRYQVTIGNEIVFLKDAKR